MLHEVKESSILKESSMVYDEAAHIAVTYYNK